MSKFDYNLAEIDRLRRAVEWSYSAGIPPGHCGMAYYPAERTVEIEERIRTYMAGGVRAEEIEAQNSAASKSAQEWGLRVRAEETVKLAVKTASDK